MGDNAYVLLIIGAGFSFIIAIGRKKTTVSA